MHSKMQTLFLASLLAAFAAFTAFATAQQVDTEPRTVTVVENQENVNLHCRIGRPSVLCLVHVPGYEQAISLRPNTPSRQQGLKYFGEGLERGSCGVTIERVTAENSGNMTCTFLVDDQTVIGAIEIVVAFPPEEPAIRTVSGSLDQVVVDSKLTFNCVAARGNPAAKISWFLDNEQLYEGVRPVEPEEIFDEASGKRYFTAESSLTRIIRAGDNGKRLTCQAEHMAYREGVSRTDLVLNVNFQPQSLPDQVIYGLQLGRTATAHVVIKANPPPVVAWTIDGLEYHQGSENGRYGVANPEPLGNNSYNVTLTIAGLTLEDLSKTYTLRASNALGAEEYRVQLRSQDEVINESSGVGIGEIVGLVLAVLIVLTAVALILVARATGRWCFRGASLNTDIGPDSEAHITPHPHDDEIDEKLQAQDPAAHFVHEGKGSSTSTSAAKIGETSDTESAEVKQPVSKAQRFLNIFTHHGQRGGVSEQANDAAPEVLDEQDGKPTEQSPAKAGKDDQTLVYAELELKPAEISFVNKPPASNESTEYAEILYVQQGGAAAPAAEEETTPTATATATQPRHHSGEDNRPVIDGSAPVKANSKGDKTNGPVGK